MSNDALPYSSTAIRSALVLLTFLVSAGLFLVLLNFITANRIQHSETVWLQQQLMAVLTDKQRASSPSIEQLDLGNITLEGEHSLPLYRVRIANSTVAFILTVIAPDGYSGSIQMLLGVDLDGVISGVRVTNHRETPGLGDDIDIARSDWIKSFDALTLDVLSEAAWSVNKTPSYFDAFTGATITPSAVVRAIYRSLGWYQKNKIALQQI